MASAEPGPLPVYDGEVVHTVAVSASDEAAAEYYPPALPVTTSSSSPVAADILLMAGVTLRVGRRRLLVVESDDASRVVAAHTLVGPWSHFQLILHRDSTCRLLSHDLRYLGLEVVDRKLRVTCDATAPGDAATLWRLIGPSFIGAVPYTQPIAFGSVAFPGAFLSIDPANDMLPIVTSRSGTPFEFESAELALETAQARAAVERPVGVLRDLRRVIAGAATPLAAGAPE